MHKSIFDTIEIYLNIIIEFSIVFNIKASHIKGRSQCYVSLHFHVQMQMLGWKSLHAVFNISAKRHYDTYFFFKILDFGQFYVTKTILWSSLCIVSPFLSRLQQIRKHGDVIQHSLTLCLLHVRRLSDNACTIKKKESH